MLWGSVLGAALTNVKDTIRALQEQNHHHQQKQQEQLRLHSSHQCACLTQASRPGPTFWPTSTPHHHLHRTFILLVLHQFRLILFPFGALPAGLPVSGCPLFDLFFWRPLWPLLLLVLLVSLWRHQHKGCRTPDLPSSSSRKCRLVKCLSNNTHVPYIQS